MRHLKLFYELKIISILEPLVNRIKALPISPSLGFPNLLVSLSNKIWILVLESIKINIIYDIDECLTCYITTLE